MKTTSSTKIKKTKKDSEYLIGSESFYNDLFKYFGITSKQLNGILKDQTNYEMLKTLLNETKNCLVKNQCNGTGIHEIPYLELDKDQKTYLLRTKRILCPKEAAKLKEFTWRNNILVDDYSYSFESSSFDQALIQLSQKYKVNLFSGWSSLYNTNTKEIGIKHSKLCVLDNSAPNSNIATETIFHALLLELAKNNNKKVGYINLITLYNIFKNRYNNLQDVFAKYTNAFSNCDYLVLTNFASISMDEKFLMYLYTVLLQTQMHKNVLIVISETDLNTIKNTSLSTNYINNNALNLLGKVLNLLSDLFKDFK